MRFALLAYSAVLGDAATPILALSTLLFAFATVLCWSHYGGECLYYLTGRPRAARWMTVAMPLCCTVGAVAAPALAWELTDLILALMTVLNVTALLVCRRTVTEETARI